MSSHSLFSLNFEVFGKVQGVFFRKYTQKQARELKIRGWCRNTDRGTVEGVLEGTKDQLAVMREWLRNKGSPHSKIERADFHGEKEIEKFSLEDFGVRK